MKLTQYRKRKGSKGERSFPIHTSPLVTKLNVKMNKETFVDTIWRGFEKRQSINHLLGSPKDVEFGGDNENQRDIIVTYPNDRKVIIGHSYSTEGEKVKGGKYYISAPKSYTHLTVTVVEPDPYGGMRRYAGTKNFKNQDGEKTAKQMTKFLKQTLGYDVTFNRFCSIESATIDGLRYK